MNDKFGGHIQINLSVSAPDVSSQSDIPDISGGDLTVSNYDPGFKNTRPVGGMGMPGMMPGFDPSKVQLRKTPAKDPNKKVPVPGKIDETYEDTTDSPPPTPPIGTRPGLIESVNETETETDTETENEGKDKEKGKDKKKKGKDKKKKGDGEIGTETGEENDPDKKKGKDKKKKRKN